MPANSNIVKPIMVFDDRPLKELENELRQFVNDSSLDQVNPYEIADQFFAVAARLRKEVKRHKKSKKKLAEIERRSEFERLQIDNLIAEVQRLKAEREY